MAAKDYEIVLGRRNAYFAKKKKRTGKGPQIMSRDRLTITDNNIIGLFEFYLRKWCGEHEGEDTIVITNGNGKELFEAKLLDKDDEDF